MSGDQSKVQAKGKVMAKPRQSTKSSTRSSSVSSLSSRLKELEASIIELRGERVLLDNQVAALYGVPTKRVNEAVFRNRAKFPRGYVFQLTAKEWQLLKSHPATSNSLGNRSVVSRGGKVKAPKAFTEKGLYMLATVLKSKYATQATLQIVETFAKVRQFTQVAKALAVETNVSKQKSLVSQSGALISDILNQEFGDECASETSIELNLAMIKIKHTIKKEKQSKGG